MERTIAHSLNNDGRTEDVRLKEIAPFSQWLLKNPVKKGLEKTGFRIPTVVQAAAIPVGKSGMDLLIQSKSGTGKTLIFCTILLENCYGAPGLHSIIVAPTREIAIQIDMVLNRIGQYCKNFHVVITIGGIDVTIDRKQLQKAKTVVGTPGRLVNLIQSGILKTTNVKLVVLDEADQLYGPSHNKNLQIILNSIPVQRQILACSATFCNKLDEGLAKIMKNPLLISTKDQITTLLGIKQYVYNLPEKMTSVLEMEDKIEVIIDIFRRVSFKLCMVFAGSQSRAESYSNYLRNSGWACELISGAQKQLKRSETFEKFQNFETRILISTDLMARGIDSEHVNLVINLEVAKDMVTYLHRIGRAGRFGSHGIAISLISSENDSKLFKKILDEIGCGMNVNEFPKAPKDGEEENFWDPNSFKTEFLKEQTTDSEESCVAAVNEQQKQTHISNTVDSYISLDTNTFCVNSKDSVINVLSAFVVENKENLIPLEAEDTPTSNRSSVQLSANTIDDASSIAADSVFSSLLEIHGPHPSLSLDNANDSDNTSVRLKEVKRDQILKKNLFLDYCTNVLNDTEKIGTEMKIELKSIENRLMKEEIKKYRSYFGDMFADYTNYVHANSEDLEKDDRNIKELNSVEQVPNEKKDDSVPVCLGLMTIECSENISEDQQKQKTQNDVTSEERLTDTQSYLQDTICATNGSYSVDSEPSIESKIKDEVEFNICTESDFYFDESLIKNNEANTQPVLNEENDQADTEHEKNANIENISAMYNIWIKEYWRQVNFIESYVKYTLDYRKQCENN